MIVVMNVNITGGQVVYSRAGRDAGRMFIVTEVADLNYVLIADGDLRKIEKPKKKKIRHLEVTDIVIEQLSEKLKKGLRINNSEIRKALNSVRT